MSRKKRKRKQSGHFCWACGRRRPNEKFSGRGHARHVCRECGKLGAEELAYRQTLRNLERCMTWEGIIPRKHRKSFEQFLDHNDRRIRDRDGLVAKLLSGGDTTGDFSALRRRFQKEWNEKHTSQSSGADPTRRTAAEIFQVAKELTEEANRCEAERNAREEVRGKQKAAAERKRYLESLAPKADKIWEDVELLLRTNNPMPAQGQDAPQRRELGRGPPRTAPRRPDVSLRRSRAARAVADRGNTKLEVTHT